MGDVKLARLRIVKIDEYQYLTCLKSSLWGSRSARFKNWQQGDYLVFIVDKALAGLAEISGKPFSSEEKIWDNGLYPHRIPIKFVHTLAVENRIPLLGEIRDVLTSAWGTFYGHGILNQEFLTDAKAEIIIKAIRSRPNNISSVQSKIEEFLIEAKELRETASKELKIMPKDISCTAEASYTEKEESAHSKAQALLIKLGKITDASVWLASNDKKRVFQGKPLGEGCLGSLPKLGLDKDATNRISLIDIIWIQQNAPIYAFEVETTTSIYSGLLRMSDLLSVVPNLKIKLFIVAPKERQNKVMTELSRPTFQKIGLNEFCKFIAAEDLESLIAKIANFKGHIQPSIIDTIAVELEEPNSHSELQ